jgi:hypothetical protein
VYHIHHHRPGEGELVVASGGRLVHELAGYLSISLLGLLHLFVETSEQWSVQCAQGLPEQPEESSRLQFANRRWR